MSYSSPYSVSESDPRASMSSLDLNSSDNPFVTRSIHQPNQHFNAFNAQQQMERQHMHPFVAASNPHFLPHAHKHQLSPTSGAAVPLANHHHHLLNKPASGLSLGLSAVAAQRQQQLAAAGPFSPPLPLPAMQRAESVPSSCASSTSSFSSSPSPIHSTVNSGATSPHSRFDSPQHFHATADANTHPDHGHQVSPPQCEMCPISLWYGCEDAYHARSVLQCYNKFLDVVTQRPVHSRAPLEFIGRVKREKLDLAKLHRVVDQYQSAQKKGSAANHRHRYASAADANTGIWRGCSSQNGRKSISSPCLASMNSPASLACSPMDSLNHLPPSPLESLPSTDAFATLDLVSIYARDTLPLGLVFPLIRHEWLLTVWHVEDGIPENFVRIRTEYDAEDAEEEQADLDEDERKEEETSKKQLKLFIKCIVKSSSVGKKSSHQSSPTLDPAAALHASASSSSIASTASSTSTSTLASTTSTFSASTASPAVPLSDPVVSTSYLYNFPIFSEDCNGAFDTFGSKANRPLGHLGQQQKPKQTDRKVKGNKNPSASPLSPLPSSLGYSGSQNDCIYDCLQALGRKVKCNAGNGGDDSCGEASTVNAELEQAAAAAAAVTATNTPASDSPHTVSKECASHAAQSSDSDNNDEEDEDPHTSATEADDDLNDIGEDVEGFEFEREDEKIDEDDGESESESESESDQSSSSDEEDSDLDNDDDDDFTRPAVKSSSKAVAIQRPAAGKSKHRHQDSDEEEFDDDDDLSSSFGSSFTSASTSVAAGSLKDELSAQLAALNGGFKPKKK